MFQRLALFVALLFVAAPAVAADGPKVAVVDFQKALQSVQDGERAKKKMDDAMKEKQASIKQLETQLRTMKDEYDKQSLILSEAARKQKEQEFMNLQMQYQQTAQQSEQEMQELYAQLMDGLLDEDARHRERDREGEGLRPDPRDDRGRRRVLGQHARHHARVDHAVQREEPDHGRREVAVGAVLHRRAGGGGTGRQRRGRSESRPPRRAGARETPDPST
jgi:outer membrane protein